MKKLIITDSIKNSWTEAYSYTGSWADDAELLEEDDFYRPNRRQWWIDNLNELKKQTTKLSRQRQAIRMISNINDFKNKDIWKEMNRFLRVIINEYDSYFAHTHDSVKRKTTKDGVDWDFLHEIKKYNFNVIEKAMYTLFSKKFLEDHFENQWGDMEFKYGDIANFLDVSKKEKLLNYLKKNK